MGGTPTPNADFMPAAQPRRAGSSVRACVDWLLAGSHPEPDEIRNELLQQRARKTKTLAVAIFASLLTATIAAALTGAPWAYAWMVAEMALGSIRIYLMMNGRRESKGSATHRNDHCADLGRARLHHADFGRLLSMRRIGRAAADPDGRHRHRQSDRRHFLA